MNYSPSVNRKLEVLNDALRSVDADSLFQNDYFELDSAYSSYHGVRFALQRQGDNYLPIDLYVESDSIRIDIYGIPEALVWSEKQIQESPETIIDLIAGLLAGYSVLEYCGSPHSNSRLYIFEKNGKLLSKFRLRGFFNVLSTWECEKILFFPVY